MSRDDPIKVLKEVFFTHLLVGFYAAVICFVLSEFEDKEIPLLLNWKGAKREKSNIIDGDWWRWVQEDKEKTITEETSRNAVNKSRHRLVFKREIQPFTPNIGPLRSLFNSGVSDDHLNQKRWISSSFGFGNKKKLRKDSKQIHRDVLKAGVDYPTTTSNVGHKFRDSRVRVNLAPKNYGIHLEDDVNSTSKMSGPVGNVGQQFHLAEYPQGLAPPNTLFSTKLYIFGERPLDVEIKRMLHNDRFSQQWEYREQPQEPKLLPTLPQVYVTDGGIYGGFHSTGKLPVNPKLDSGQWAKYTTETNFERGFEPFTALRYNPPRMTLPFEDLSRTGIQYTARPTAMIGENNINSQYAEPNRHRQFTSEQFQKHNLSSNENVEEMEGEDNFSTQNKNEFSKSERKLDVFDQISIPTVSNSDTSAQLHRSEKPSKNIDGGRSMDKVKHEEVDVVNNVAPPLENHFKSKQTVFYDEGANYDMLPDEKEPYENNPLELSPTKLQAKANKNGNRHFTALARDSAADEVKSFHRAGGSCGNCGGGVNISIMMASHPATLSSTLENSGSHISRTTSAYDKNKKKKERKKKTNRNSATPSSEPVVGSKRDKGRCYSTEEKIGLYRGKNDITITSKKFLKSTGQRRIPYFLNDLQNTNEVNKTQYREITAGKCLEAAKHRTSYDSPNNNIRFQSYLNIVHKIQHPIPTVYGVQTVGRTWEEQDDRDELQELYDEQNNTNAEDNNINLTELPYPSYSRSTLSDSARNFLFGKNSRNNASARNGASKKFEKNNLDSKVLEQETNSKYSSQNKKSRESTPIKEGKTENLYEPWEKYAFPMNNNYHGRLKLRSGFKTTIINNQKSKCPISFREHVKQKYMKPHRETGGNEYYDQWEALDADLNNDFTEGGKEDVRVKVRNMKREVDHEDFENDAQGFYRLSSGRSFRNPTNMIISAIRHGKVNHGKKVFQDEDMPGEEEYVVTSKPTPVAITQN